ncbi:hypothetical protein E4T56_gene20421 [Termitomyces sp. T112]|nr:hypothetical protein E4T56_gene20421 [Termitomyces sp. T112]
MPSPQPSMLPLTLLSPWDPPPLFLTPAYIINSSPGHSMLLPLAREYPWAGTALSTFPANGNNPHIYPRGFPAPPPNSTYLPPTHYYVYLIPAAAPAPLEHPDNYFPPQLPFPAQIPPFPRQQ